MTDGAACRKQCRSDFAKQQVLTGLPGRGSAGYERGDRARPPGADASGVWNGYDDGKSPGHFLARHRYPDLCLRRDLAPPMHDASASRAWLALNPSIKGLNVEEFSLVMSSNGRAVQTLAAHLPTAPCQSSKIMLS